MTGKMNASNTIIAAQLRDYYRSPPEQKQSFHEKTRCPLELKKQLKTLGIPVHETAVDPADFQQWRKSFPFMEDFYQKLGDVFIEKLLEHYLTFKYLDIKPGDRFIDVAAAGSPFADGLAENGFDSYKLDIAYKEGVDGIRIGADGTDTQLSDCFADVLALHCAYETFMGDADWRFIREAERVLKPEGRLGIVPLYLDPVFFNLTSPYCDQNEVVMDDCALRVWREDVYKEKFSRHYSPLAFHKRIFLRLTVLNARVLFFSNLDQLQEKFPGQRIYCHFMLFAKK